MKYSLINIFKTFNLKDHIKFNKKIKKLFSGVNTLDKSPLKNQAPGANVRVPSNHGSTRSFASDNVILGM